MSIMNGTRILALMMFVPGVSRRSKCAREERVKTSHFERGIRPMSLLAAMPRKEARRGECAQNDRHTVDSFTPCARLVPSADRQNLSDQPADGEPIRPAAARGWFKVDQRAD